MTSQGNWERDLKEVDGSCRDINLSEHLSREAALALLGVISGEWTLLGATDSDGLTISSPDFPGCVGVGEGALSTSWGHGSYILQMQCYLHWKPAGGVFAELTFFPNDIVEGEFSFSKFTAFLTRLLAATGSTEYYVRYENGSWRHGNTALASGVIFSHMDLPLGGS